MICALEDFSQSCPEHAAESEMADNLARRVYAQLSDYARGGIDGSLKKHGITMGAMRPDFDSKALTTDFENIVMYDKMGAKFKVEIEGEELIGRYVRDAFENCTNAEEGLFEGGYFIMELEDKTLRAIDWGKIVSMKRFEELL